MRKLLRRGQSAELHRSCFRIRLTEKLRGEALSCASPRSDPEGQGTAPRRLLFAVVAAAAVMAAFVALAVVMAVMAAVVVLAVVMTVVVALRVGVELQIALRERLRRRVRGPGHAAV